MKLVSRGLQAGNVVPTNFVEPPVFGAAWTIDVYTLQQRSAALSKVMSTWSGGIRKYGLVAAKLG